MRLKIYLVLVIGAFLWALGSVWATTEKVCGVWGVIAYGIVAAAWLAMVLVALHKASLPYPVDMKYLNIAYAVLSVLTFGVAFVVILLTYGDTAAVLWAGMASVGLLGMAYEWSRGRV